MQSKHEEYQSIKNVKQYPDQAQPEWKKSRRGPDEKALADFKKNLKSSTKMLQETLVETINQLKDKGKGIRELANKVKSSEKDTVMEELNAIKKALFENGVTAKEAGISYSERESFKIRARDAERSLFKLKTGLEPSADNLHAIGTYCGLYNNGEWVEGFNNTRMLELVLLDDWPEWLSKAIKYLKSLLPTIIPHVADMVLPGSGQVLQGLKPYVLGSGDNQAKAIEAETFPGVSKRSTVDVSMPKHERQEGLVNHKNSLLKVNQMTKSVLKPDLVDIPSIATVLCPEYYKAVARFDDAYPGSIYTTFETVPVVPSTTTGGFYCVVNTADDNIGDTSAYRYMSYSTATSAYNPATGAYTSATTVANPLSSQTANIASVRLVGCTVAFEPSVNFNSSLAIGQVDFWHDPSSISDTTNWNSPTPYLSLNNVGYKPFYQRGSIMQSYSQTLYETLDQNSYEPTTANATNVTRPIVFILSGGNLSGNEVGKIRVTRVWNVVPTNAGLASLAMQNPGVGPYTSDILDSTFTLAPQIFVASKEHKMAVIQAMKETDSTYGAVLDCILSCTYERKHSLPFHEFQNGPSEFEFD